MCCHECLSLSSKPLDMNVFQEPCCSILGVLLVFLLQGSCVDSDAEVVHKAVGDSLELIADYPKENLEVQWKYNWTNFAEYQNSNFKKVKPELFHERLKMYKEDNISVTVADLKVQDSGIFSIVAEGKSGQYNTKLIELHVHGHITDVEIVCNDSWLKSQNICMFNLRCLASGDPNPSYSWTGHQIQTQGSHLNISLRPAESAALTCTANNTFSIKKTTKTVMCTEKSDDSNAGFPREYLLIAVGVGIVVVVIFSGALAVCYRWRKNKEQGESEADITVYEDVKTDVPAKKRSESVVNGMCIYETVDAPKPSQNLPQTLYDKINYQRHPAVSPSTSSPYQEVL